jgi:hypothetical protein
MEVESVVNLFSNVGFPMGLLILVFFAGRAIWPRIKLWGDAVTAKVVQWFESQVSLVEALKGSLHETRTDIQHVAKTQEIMARQQVKSNRIFDRLVTVMENSTCVATDKIRTAKQDYDSDEFTSTSEDDSG